MNSEQAAALRAPFADELIGKLPRVTCGACREARSKVCTEHSKSRCGECGNWITSAHIHLDYVGHADATDRLLAVDPAWSWEPLAVDERGLPALDRVGGLWIRLTVLGVTRPGYGHADGKTGGDAVKEAIGDAIRNAGMRFGIGLDLWRKEKPAVDDGGSRPPAARKATSTRKATADDQGSVRLPDGTRRRMMALFGQLGLSGDAKRAERLRLASEWVGRELGSANELSPREAALVIAALEARLAEPSAGHDDGPAS